jgi:hypothetical protein
VWREGFERGRRHVPGSSQPASVGSASAPTATTTPGYQAASAAFHTNTAVTTAAASPAAHTSGSGGESHAPVSALPVSHLEAILDQVRQLKRAVGAELDQLEQEVEALVSQIRTQPGSSSGKGKRTINEMGPVGVGVGMGSTYQHDNDGHGCQLDANGGGEHARAGGGAEGSGMAV